MGPALSSPSARREDPVSWSYGRGGTSLGAGGGPACRTPLRGTGVGVGVGVSDSATVIVALPRFESVEPSHAAKV